MNRIMLAGATLLLSLGVSVGAPAQQRAVTAAPLMETLRGEQPIVLRALHIGARLRGGLAETTVWMEFYNPNPRPLEGKLQFPLLDGQQVTGFALDFDGHLRAAVPIGKAKGRQVFEAVERVRIDPALLEKTQGNNFRLRVYPVPAHGTRQVELRYSEALARDGRMRRFRLPLAYGAMLREFRLDIDSDAPAPPEASGALGALAFPAQGGLFRAHVERAQFTPTGELALRLPTPAQPQVSGETRGGDTYFVAEIPVDATATARRVPRRVGLLWDASMSGAARDHAAEFALLDRYFHAMDHGEVRLVRLRDRPEAAQAFRVRRGDWSALRRVLEATPYDGASALADWRPDTDIDEYLLVSDGLLTDGPLRFPTLAARQRLYAINASPSADRDRLRGVAEPTGGRLVELRPGHASEDADALLATRPTVASLGGQGVDALSVAKGDAGGGYVRVAGRMRAPDATLVVRFADGRTVRVAVDGGAPPSPFAARQWAAQQLDALAGQPELHRDEIAALGTRFGLATSETSLIVLDRVQDYVDHDIAPPPELAVAYAALRAERDKARTDERRSHLDEVVQAFAAKVAWWEQDFPKGPLPPPAKMSSLKGIGSIAGETRPGATVIVANRATGLRRQITADANGAYRVAALPIGTYQVTAGGRTREVQVTIGGTSSSASLGTVAVVGEPIHAIDAMAAESDTVLTAEQIARAPVGRDVTSVALLAPGTVGPPPAAAAADAAAPGIAGSGSAVATIAVKPWQADAPYLGRLRAAKDGDLYAAYLRERPAYAASVGFYVDVADLLLARGQKDLGLRVLSNLAEMDLDDRQVLRVLGYRLVQAGEPALAVPVFEHVLRIADDEPQSFRDLGNALAAAGRGQEAVDALTEVVLRAWDERFADVSLIALAELNAIVAASAAPLDTHRLDPRLRRNLPLDLRVVLAWDADDSDMDLWVTDPNGEKCFYQNKLTYQGGRLSTDFTGGYGPEEFALRVAKPGRYKVQVNYFGDQQQVVAGPTSLQVRFATKFGTTGVQEKLVSLRVKEDDDAVLVGEFDVE